MLHVEYTFLTIALLDRGPVQLIHIFMDFVEQCILLDFTSTLSYYIPGIYFTWIGEVPCRLIAVGSRV